MHHLRQAVRKTKDRDSSPSIGIIDSRSVRTAHHFDRAAYGLDGGKKVKGVRNIYIVDSLGLPMAAKMHAANIHDSAGGVDTTKLLQYYFPRLKKNHCGWRFSR